MSLHTVKDETSCGTIYFDFIAIVSGGHTSGNTHRVSTFVPYLDNFKKDSIASCWNSYQNVLKTHKAQMPILDLLDS